MRYVLLVAMLGLAAVTGLAGCEKFSGTKLPQSSIPQTWTHKEVAERLKERGVKARQIPTNRGAGLNGNSAFLVAESSKYQTDDEADKAYDAKSGDVVLCVLLRTEQDAKDKVGAEGKGVARGRFIFVGGEPLLGQVLAAMP